jgi:putative acetyltransferase
MTDVLIRQILSSDDMALATIIRNGLTEFKAAKPGTVYFDPTTDALYNLFKTPNSIYFVAVQHGEVLGGCGIYPTANLPAGTCELVKLYLSPTARGKGLGKLLMEKSMLAAKEMGYTKIYLETMPELNIAVPMYEKLGFTSLDEPLGNSGHSGCGIWMIKAL